MIALLQKKYGNLWQCKDPYGEGAGRSIIEQLRNKASYAQSFFEITLGTESSQHSYYLYMSVLNLAPNVS